MTMTDEEFEQACQFMIELGTLGHRYGLASSYLESYLSRFPNELGFSGHVLATPQWLDFIFWRTGDQPQYQHRYFVASCGGVTVEQLKRYVENQRMS